MLTSSERISRPVEPFVSSDTGFRDYTDFAKHPIDAVTISQFPPRAAHKKLQMSVKPAADVASSYTYDIRTRRIMREVCNLPNIITRIHSVDAFHLAERADNGSTSTDRSLCQ